MALHCICSEFWYQTKSPVDEGRPDGDDVINWQLMLACVITFLVAVSASLLVAFVWTRRHAFRGNIQTLRQSCRY